MKIQDMIETILQGSQQAGTYPLPEIFRITAERGMSCLAVSRETGTLACLAFVRGEPEGAIFADEKGELYGDKAVILVTGREQFGLYTTKEDIAEALVMGCRIFEKTRVKQGLTHAIPEFGTKSEGVGHLTLRLQRNREPQKGIRISVRKDGKIVGSDFTSEDGSAGFRVLFGDYDCIVQDKDQQVRVFSIRFHETAPEITLEI